MQACSLVIMGATGNLARRKLTRTQPKKLEELPSDRMYRLRVEYRRLIYRHRVKEYPGPITLLINEKQYRVDKKMGWSSIALGGLQAYSTPGDHWTRYTDHSREFARRLLECLEPAHAEIARRRQLRANRTGEPEISLARNLRLSELPRAS